MSKIAWTEKTWNPVVGCTKCSPGCDNCYAERMANRLGHMGQEKYQNVIYSPDSAFDKAGTWIGRAFCDEKSLEIPLHWRKPRQIFVCSMGDLFHKDVPFEFIDKVFQTMALCWGNQTYRNRSYPNHTFQVLTKRPERMLEYMSGDVLKRWGGGAPIFGPLSNVWLGVTVCNQKEADEKIPILLQTPAAVRFISIEPCLGEIIIDPYLHPIDSQGRQYPPALDWVILGGESGPGARPMHPDWARSVRDQCKAANVPFFFKQWGEWGGCTRALHTRRMHVNDSNWHLWPDTGIESAVSIRVGKKKAGHLLDGKEIREYPIVR